MTIIVATILTDIKVLHDFVNAMASGISVTHFYQHMGVSFVLWILVILAVLIDLWDGVYTARTLGQRVHSHKLRVTVRKIGEYWRFILMGFVADTVGILFPVWAWPYLSIGICLAIIGIEGKSVVEHAQKRKSHLAQVPTMLKDIISCTTEHQALDILTRVKEMMDEENMKLLTKDH